MVFLVVFFSDPFPPYFRLQHFLFHSNTFRNQIVYFNALFLPVWFSTSVVPLHERHFCLIYHRAYENNTLHASPLYFISSHWKVNSILPHWVYLSYSKSMLAWRALSHNCSDKALHFPLLRLLPHPQLRAPLSSFSLSLYEQIIFFLHRGPLQDLF